MPHQAWQVVTHITNQPGGLNLHPLLTRANPQNALVIVMTADRGLAARTTRTSSAMSCSGLTSIHIPVKYITVGRKGTGSAAAYAKAGPCRF